MNDFPEYFTIDDIGLHSLNEYLIDEFENETVLIKVIRESEVTEEDNVNESIKRNTIIESLDKKTLLELRGLIDKKLRSL